MENMLSAVDRRALENHQIFDSYWQMNLDLTTLQSQSHFQLKLRQEESSKLLRINFTK